MFEAGALSGREKALIALAAANALQCPYCIDVYTRASLENGSNLEILELPLGDSLPRHIAEFDPRRLAGRAIATGLHCYGGTAGAGVELWRHDRQDRLRSCQVRRLLGCTAPAPGSSWRIEGRNAVGFDAVLGSSVPPGC